MFRFASATVALPVMRARSRPVGPRATSFQAPGPALVQDADPSNVRSGPAPPFEESCGYSVEGIKLVSVSMPLSRPTHAVTLRPNAVLAEHDVVRAVAPSILTTALQVEDDVFRPASSFDDSVETA